ncbi:hypothetical protein F4678DRAFT_456036 [Xylaria arbuscula]|nr:hypothetical protein F4678DRAFT_456036 [Xylaria arbuscula]
MEVQLGPTPGRANGVDSSAAVDARYHDPYELHRHHHQHQPHYPYHGYANTSGTRKRKAESQDNERLSKRLSLLNLEKGGQKLYVPVETPSINTPAEEPEPGNNLGQSDSSSAVTADGGMQLDDTKYKVYIYDIDAELSSADENSESESSLPGSPTSGRGRLVFLPDIEKHLSRSRIPPAVLANNDGELAGHNINDMQMVLYSEPSSLTVPREHDSVRKAILEARARARERQKEDQGEMRLEPPSVTPSPAFNPQRFGFPNRIDMGANGPSGYNITQNTSPWREDEDVDAMDMD